MKDADDDGNGMSENRAIIHAFCAQFSPPLRYIRTERINMVPFPDAWQASYWEDRRSIGITAVAYNGQLHAFIEKAGKGSEVAVDAGKIIATAFGLLRDEAN